MGFFVCRYLTSSYLKTKQNIFLSWVPQFSLGQSPVKLHCIPQKIDSSLFIFDVTTTKSSCCHYHLSWTWTGVSVHILVFCLFLYFEMIQKRAQWLLSIPCSFALEISSSSTFPFDCQALLRNTYFPSRLFTLLS